MTSLWSDLPPLQTDSADTHSQQPILIFFASVALAESVLLPFTLAGLGSSCSVASTEVLSVHGAPLRVLVLVTVASGLRPLA